MPVPINRFIAIGYRNALRDSLPVLSRRLNAVGNSLAAPALESLPIGSGRRVRAAVIFFDICGFTILTNSDDINTLKRSLLILNFVIPAMMRVLFRYDAYVEKNTGDGLMAILGISTDEQTTATNALNVCEEMFFVLHEIVNPMLFRIGINPISARIGVDMGNLLISRIGVPSGSSNHGRNSLTAVGPAANLACKLQGMADDNEIWCGDAIRSAAPPERRHLFDCVTPANWTWTYGPNPNARYDCWRYNGIADPFLIPSGERRVPPSWP